MENEEEPKAIRDPQEYISELEEIVRHSKEIRSIVGHEIRNRLLVIKLTPESLRREVLSLQEGEIMSKEKIDKLLSYADTIKRNFRQVESISTILQLSSMRVKDIRSKYESFNLEELARESVLSFETELYENEVALVYEYEKESDGQPIYVHSHRGLMSAIMNTVLTNWIKHTPQGSIGKLGIKKEDKYLHIITENLLGQSKKEYEIGGTGVGFVLLDSAARMFKGEVSGEVGFLSDESYPHRERYGSTTAKEIRDKEAFLLRIKIPIKELTYHQPESKRG